MHGLALAPSRPLRVLAVGAHPDDIEIGAGGAIMKLIDDGAIAELHWLVLTGRDGRNAEARASAEAMLAPLAEASIDVLDHRDGYLPDEWSAVKDRFESLKSSLQPDLIFTHRRDDLHQDHRVCAELTWNTYRDHLVLEYEVPKYDGDLASPNAFVTLTRELRDRKVSHLLRYFPSQVHRPWFTEELFAGLLRIRGMECAAPEAFAEAFFCRKAVLA
jgi:LmbE family N-acetylglucosaminyl deacetylase